MPPSPLGEKKGPSSGEMGHSWEEVQGTREDLGLSFALGRGLLSAFPGAVVAVILQVGTEPSYWTQTLSTQ